MAEWSPKFRKVSGGEDKERLTFIGSLISERRFEEALRESLAVLQDSERSFDANLFAGRALQGLKKFEEAMPYLQRAAGIDPMQAQAHFLVGMSAFMLSQYQTAVQKFQTAINIDPSSPKARLGMAQVLYRRGDLENAMGHVDEVLKRDPKSAAARLIRARLLSKNGQVEEAAEELQGLVEDHPQNYQALISLAATYIQGGLFAEAARVLEVAVTHRDNATAWAMLGRARLKAGDYPGAEQAIRKSMGGDETRRRSIGKALQLVEALIPQNKLTEAKEMLAQMPRKGPLASVVQKSFGDVLVAEGLYHDAEKAYRAALSESEDGAQVLADIDEQIQRAHKQGDAAYVAAAIGGVLSERLEQARRNFGERDMNDMLDRVRPAMSQELDGD